MQQMLISLISALIGGLLVLLVAEYRTSVENRRQRLVSGVSACETDLVA